MKRLSKKHLRIIQTSNIGMKYLQYMDANMFFIVLPIIAIQFTASTYLIRLSTSAYFFSTSLAVFLSSLIIDKLGIKRSIRVAISLFLLGGLITCFSQEIISLTISRAISGFGIGLVPTIVRIISSNLEQKNMSHFLMVQNIFASWAPIFAVLIASGLTTWFSWKFVYIFLVIYAGLLYFYLSSSLPKIKHKPIVDNFSSCLHLYKKLIFKRDYINWTLAYSCFTSGLTVFLLVATFIYAHTLKLSIDTYGLFLSLIFIALSASSLIGIFLLKLLGRSFCGIAGLICMIAASFIMLFFAIKFPPSVINLSVAMSIYMFGYGLSYPVYTHKIATTASSISISASMALMATLANLANSLDSIIVAHFHIRNATPLSLFLLILLALTVIFSLLGLIKLKPSKMTMR